MQKIMQITTENVRNLFMIGFNMTIIKKICNFLSGRNDRLEALQESRQIIQIIKSGNLSFEESRILCDMVEAEDTLRFILDVKLRDMSYESALKIIDGLIEQLKNEME